MFLSHHLNLVSSSRRSIQLILIDKILHIFFLVFTGVNMSAVERDFLRTEGDPGAAGYTIKEAIALTRSVV